MLNGEIRLKKQSWPLYRRLTALILTLTGLGLVMVHNTTFTMAGQKYQDPYFFLKKELFFALLGFFSFVLARKISLERLRKFSKVFVLFSIFLLGLVLIAGKEVHGAKRWLALGPFSFQPSEFAKVAVIIYLSDFLARKEGKLRNPLHSFIPPGILVGMNLVLILAERDLGTPLLLAGVILILYFVAGAPLKYLGILAITVMLGGSGMVWTESYRRTRIFSFLESFFNPLEGGYHIRQSLIGVGSGGLFGVGPGHGRQKLFFLPEAHTDFIFANIAEELGFFGSLFFLALFLFLIHYGLETARRTDNKFQQLLALGITSLIGLQAFFHVAVVISLLPPKGITLPFISYGGSSLLFTLFTAGLLVQIAHQLPSEEVWE